MLKIFVLPVRPDEEIRVLFAAHDVAHGRIGWSNIGHDRVVQEVLLGSEFPVPDGVRCVLSGWEAHFVEQITGKHADG